MDTISQTIAYQWNNAYLNKFDDEYFSFLRNSLKSYHDDFYLERKYILDAIDGIKIFARDSIEALEKSPKLFFEQFDRQSDCKTLSKAISLLERASYQNLAFVHKTDSVYSILAKPLDFFNQCLNDLFDWLVYDLEQKAILPTWNAWSEYKKFCELSGDDDLDNDVPNFDIRLKRNTLLNILNRNIDELSKKNIHRISPIPEDYTCVAGEIDNLLRKRKNLPYIDTAKHLNFCLTSLFECLRSASFHQQWGIFGERTFILLILQLQEVKEYTVSSEEANEIDGLWIRVRSSLINFLSGLSTVTKSQYVNSFSQWLIANRELSYPSAAEQGKRVLNAKIIQSLPELCRDLILDVCEKDFLDMLKDAYADTLWANFDRFDMPEVLPQGRLMNKSLKPSPSEACYAKKIDRLIAMGESHCRSLRRIEDLMRDTASREEERQKRHETEDKAYELWKQYSNGELGPPIHKDKKRSKADLLEHPAAAPKLEKSGIKTIKALNKAIRNAQNRHKTHQSGKN